jgi:DNA-binding IclR family transcriptional regulator
MQVLDLFDELRREATVIEICSTLGYPQSSTSALLRSLTTIGILHYDRRKRTYIPTNRVALLGTWINERLFQKGQLVQAMRAINDKTGNAVLLSTRNGFYAKYIHVIQATTMLRLHITLGTERSLAASGAGYAILSTYPDSEIQRTVRAINAYTQDPEKVVSISKLMKTIEEVRTKGYVFKRDVVVKGGGIIAMPLHLENQAQPLVVGVGGAADVLQQAEDEIVAVMREELGNIDPGKGGANNILE